MNTSKREIATKTKKLEGLNDKIPFTDARTKEKFELNQKDFDEELRKIYEKVSKVVSKIEKLGKYQLQEIEISIGVSSGVLVVTVEGGIALRYSLPVKN
jgi:hypothetical protein